MIDFMRKDVEFDDVTCELFAKIIQQNELNVKVLFYIVRCETAKIPVTVKNITSNVEIIRRIAVKNPKNNLVSYLNKKGPIDRKMAEKIVDRLAYASLIYFDVQRPYKYIKVTTRGAQVAIYIKKQQIEENKQ